MSFLGEGGIETFDWSLAPDPNRNNYHMVHMHHSLTQGVMFYAIHANATGTEGQPGYTSAKAAAMHGAEETNPGWVADWAHHQWQSRGVFRGGILE